MNSNDGFELSILANLSLIAFNRRESCSLAFSINEFVYSNEDNVSCVILSISSSVSLKKSWCSLLAFDEIIFISRLLREASICLNTLKKSTVGFFSWLSRNGLYCSMYEIVSLMSD